MHRTLAGVGPSLKLRLLLRSAIGRALRRRGKIQFLDRLRANPCVLDVGCGHEGPTICKFVRSDAYYIGIDICDYAVKLPPSKIADEYLIASPDEFGACISTFEDQVDAVISSHNIEHCDEPELALRAMCRALKTNGTMYLSFPTADSVRFPHRKGTLNFFDDPTHRNVLSAARVVKVMKEEGVRPTFWAERYRPATLMVLGFILEPISALLRRNMPLGATWALYGFETVIWAKKS